MNEKLKRLEEQRFSLVRKRQLLEEQEADYIREQHKVKHLLGEIEEDYRQSHYFYDSLHEMFSGSEGAFFEEAAYDISRNHMESLELLEDEEAELKRKILDSRSQQDEAADGLTRLRLEEVLVEEEENAHEY